MARTSASTEITPADDAVQGEVSRMKRVVIQRPAGNTDSHIFLGFNSFEGHFPFEQPVELPAEMVDYLRGQKRAEFHPDEKGNPVISWVSVLGLMDA